MTKTMYITAGLPAAGKSTSIRKLNLDHLPAVDPDEFKKSHPDYDPKNILQEVHDWSKLQARKLHYELLSKDGSFIVDGTGTNVEKYLHYISEAKEVGFKVVLVYVKVTLETSLKRNQMRDRSVPENIIIEKSKVIDKAQAFLKNYADELIIIENN